MERSAIDSKAKFAVLLLLFVLACKDIERPPIFSLLLSGGGTRIGVVTTDFGSAGRFSVLTPDGVPLPGLSPIHSDAVARFQNGQVTVINRLNRDNIQVLDPAVGFLTVQEFSVGSGTNPHDYVRLSDAKGYVSLYNRNYIQIVQPATGFLTGTLSLAGYADADGLPETEALHLEGSLLYAAVQRLDRNQSNLPPSGISTLVEIDTGSDALTASFNFPASNPFGKFHRVLFSGVPHLVIPCPARLGFISEMDGGVVAFNLQTRSFRPGFLYAETTAGGDILDVEILSDTEGYATVLDSVFNKSLQKFNPSTGQKLAVLSFSPATAGTISGLLLAPNGYLYAGDASFSQPGIKIYATQQNDTLLTPVPVSVGLRPFDLVYIP
jgi:hypothetical protein